MVRIFLVPVFMVLLYLDFEINSYINSTHAAMVVFIIAALTDVADGIIARTRNQVTDFGKFMDPLADKILTFAAMLWFVRIDVLPAWIVLIVIVREFMVTGIRLVAAAKDKVIAASLFGKIKTTVTVICLIVLFLYDMLDHWMLITCWVLISATTIVSGVDYFVKNKEIMKLDK